VFYGDGADVSIRVDIKNRVFVEIARLGHRGLSKLD
jgi:hypothetical protein